MTRLAVDLQWENPANIQNNLSITIYLPDRCVFGPFTEAEPFYSNPQKMQMYVHLHLPPGWCRDRRMVVLRERSEDSWSTELHHLI